MSKWHGGKGSNRRPPSIDTKTFDENWDRIFKKKQETADVSLKKIDEELRLHDTPAKDE